MGDPTPKRGLEAGAPPPQPPTFTGININMCLNYPSLVLRYDGGGGGGGGL